MKEKYTGLVQKSKNNNKRKISEKKLWLREQKLLENERRIRQLSVVSSEGIIIVDLGKIIYANQTIGGMFGYNPGYVTGIDIKELPFWNTPKILIKSTDNEKTFELTGIRKDNSTFPAEVVIKVILFKDRQMTLLVFRDITERKRIETELIKTREEVEKAVKSKSEFLDNMSNEIRMPINSIINMTSLLLKTQVSSEQRLFVEAIIMSGDSLLKVINDLIDFSELQ
jgi:PAS domain S-box-containing protein